VVTAERAYSRAVTQATPRLVLAARQATAQPDGLRARLSREIQQAQVAYYPFETATPARLEDLPPPLPPRRAPREIVSLQRSAYGAPAPHPPRNARERELQQQMLLGARVPRGWVPEQMTLSPSGVPGQAAAVVQGPLLRKGVHGQALFFNETNRGLLPARVGWYDRTDPFSFSFWFLAARTYEDVPILNHRSEQNAGSTGYTLAIRNGKLWVSLAHSPPANMIGVLSKTALPVGKWMHIGLSYDGSSRAAGLRLYVNGQSVSVDVDHDTLTRTMLPWSDGDVFDPFVGLAFGGRFREKFPVDAGLDELRVFGRALTEMEIRFLANPDSINAAPQKQREQGLQSLLLATDPAIVRARDALTAARREHNLLASRIPQVLIMRERTGPVTTRILERGLYSSPGEVVTPRGLDAVFPWDKSLPPNRLGLARWLFDARNPLTARVFVNRLWQMHFGRGLVETSEDFGLQGSIPTHPELLDYLATTFVKSGWNIRELQRQIVLSATYRQESYATEEMIARDPANQLLARGPSWRMTAEMVRDRALAAAGLLEGKVGGPSVTPYQPAGIWNPQNAFYEYPDSRDIPAADHHRRTLYTFIKRNAVHPGAAIFDFTNRTESRARRSSSNTPLQTLALLNDPQYVEAYRGMAQRALTVDGDDDAQLTRLYRLATRVNPSEAQLQLVRDFYQTQRKALAGKRDRAQQQLSVGVTQPNTTIDPVTLAAMTNAAALVMNSPESYLVQ
jgi:hypothetical protein